MMNKRNIIIGLMLLAIGYTSCSYYEHHYTRKDCRVIEVDKEVVTVVNNTDNTWSFTDEGFAVDDIVDLKMYDNGTINRVDDDKIIKVIRK